jgi:hypothetical protein
MLTRIALYTTLGVLMDALGFAVTGLGFWCVLGLFLACDRLSRIEGEQFGTADGVRRYLAMSDEQQAEIRKMIKQWEGK